MDTNDKQISDDPTDDSYCNPVLLKYTFALLIIAYIITFLVVIILIVACALFFGLIAGFKETEIQTSNFMSMFRKAPAGGMQILRTSGSIMGKSVDIFSQQRTNSTVFGNGAQSQPSGAEVESPPLEVSPMSSESPEQPPPQLTEVPELESHNSVQQPSESPEAELPSPESTASQAQASESSGSASQQSSVQPSESPHSETSDPIRSLPSESTPQNSDQIEYPIQVASSPDSVESSDPSPV